MNDKKILHIIEELKKFKLLMNTNWLLKIILFLFLL